MNGEKSIPSGWESHIYSVTGEKTEFIIPKKGVYIEVPKQPQERLLSLDRRGESIGNSASLSFRRCDRHLVSLAMRRVNHITRWG